MTRTTETTTTSGASDTARREEHTERSARPETTAMAAQDIGMDSRVAMEEARARQDDGTADSSDTAQRRAEHAIERSFVGGSSETHAGTANAGSTGSAETGTADRTYNLVSVIYHALQGIDTYEAYVRDAERTGDRELARFFRDAQEENRRRADRAKELLRERLR